LARRCACGCRGWTASNAAIALASYRETNVALAAAARRWIGVAGA
jgi:hypothetical protein